MIYKTKNAEYTQFIADLMISLDDLDKFVLVIHVGEASYGFDESCTFKFLTEGLKISNSDRDNYYWYDTIELFQIFKDGVLKDVMY